jgi:hypothetical protein
MRPVRTPQEFKACIGDQAVLAIQSVSSGNFLDGRNPGMHDPCLSPGAGRNPATDRYFQWRLVPTSGGHFAIKSISSGGCLDGRNPHMTELLLSDRDPTNDHFLQWDFGLVEGSSQCLKWRLY